ncbi:MAG: TlpA disulfide reductase family protein [Odoribacter sp.]
MRSFFMMTLFLLCINAHAQDDDRGYIVQVGDKAPDIIIQYIDGTQKKLSDFKGKIVMLQFTASWCGVCRKEMPFIEKDIWQKHKNNPKFALIGIDLMETPEKTQQFAKDINITYPLTLDPEGKAFYSYAAKGAGVTRNIIIDKKGKIVFMTRLYDPEEFKKMCEVIDQLLK